MKATCNSIADRAVEIYQSGKTRREVAVEIGRSHEWVRQILQIYGVPLRPRKAVPDEAELEKKQAKRREMFQARWGMSPEKMDEIRSKYGTSSQSPLNKFSKQKTSAKRRGVKWEFNFSSWWSVWEKSGKWDNRGRSGFVMGRKKDEGSYCASNVEIITSKQNGLEATINRPWKSRIYKDESKRPTLTDDQVRAIRISNDSQRKIAQEFDISQSHVSLIKRRLRSKDVSDEKPTKIGAALCGANQGE